MVKDLPPHRAKKAVVQKLPYIHNKTVPNNAINIIAMVRPATIPVKALIAWKVQKLIACVNTYITIIKNRYVTSWRDLRNNNDI